MRFPDYGVQIPDDQQEAFNDKVLHAARNPSQAAISRADAFNGFSGRGNTHRLSRLDYPDYESYARDKRSREAGQFFTPGWLARVMVAAVQLEDHETVCDPACGHGALFNACVDSGGAGAERLFGCEFDSGPADVARYLFPEATIEETSFGFYHPGLGIDCLLANPPFALKVQVGRRRHRSEEALLLKAAEYIRPGGIGAAIVPASLYKDAFGQKSRIARLERLWRPLGRIDLDDQAFARAGVSGLETSVLLLQRRGRILDEVHVQAQAHDECAQEERSQEERSQEERSQEERSQEERSQEEGHFEDLQTVTNVPTLVLSTPQTDAQKEAAVRQAAAFGAENVAPARALAEEHRAKLDLEYRQGRTASEEDQKARRTFHDRVTKLLFDISRSEASSQLPRAKALYERFRAQGDATQRPSHLSRDEWLEMRLSPQDVLTQLEEILSGQHDEKKRASLSRQGLLPDMETLERCPEEAIRVVKHTNAIRLKAYTPEAEERLKRRRQQGLEDEWNITELAVSDDPLPKHVQMTPYAKVVERKRRRRRVHEGDVMQMEPPEELVEWARSCVIEHPNREAVRAGEVPPRFNLDETQAKDLARLLMRRYTLLSWAMGTGKTAVSYCFMQVVLGNWTIPPRVAAAMRQGAGQAEPLKCGFVLSTAFALDETWRPFLDVQPGASYRVLATRSDVIAAQEQVIKDGPDALAGEILVVSLSRAYDLRGPLHRLQRLLSYRSAVVLDESDEIANPDALQTKGVLAAFRRSEAALAMTGTPTRNHIGEVYSQLELLYNNSALFGCHAPKYYPRDKNDEPQPMPNRQCGKPFPAYHGEKLFSQCFAPRKKTVFGILSHDTDVYNADALADLLARTRIVRTFAEVVGEGLYSIKHQGVDFSPAEAALHERIMKEFSRLWSAYYESTGNQRKDAGLRAVRQLFLLIASARFPHLFDHYGGARSDYNRKMHHVKRLVKASSGQRVAIGLRRKEVFEQDYLAHWAGFLSDLDREVFIVRGTTSERGEICRAFQRVEGAILLSTQQSLPSSVNIPKCSKVILPELPWNAPACSQYWFRFIRRDMQEPTTIHIVTYRKSIETNTLKLLVAKEKLNRFVRDGELPSTAELLDSMQIEPGALEAVLEKVRDVEGHVSIDWSSQKAHS